ncbi:tubulin delta chain-like isoform X2 [Acanthaster planci]|nr:tubulin delta chain-like isoform X2 [Acanthaster planci]XP_022099006.1 tubulin delta chain-like isoform X2 [Acanthaster planci]
MSTVFVQVGQCGNQVGKEFYRTVSKLQEQRPIFADGDGKWRCIHVDSEAKVVKSLYFANKKCLRESNIVSGKYGRGTNWAIGYHEDSILSHTLEVLRREVERCDSYCGTVMIHSLGGGTGSGQGSRLCENIKDEYPMAYILSAVVAPHISGESPLQNYNTILSLGWLQRFSDAVDLFKNDEILHLTMGANAANKTRNSQQTSLADMNCYISDCIAGMCLPLKTNLKKNEKSYLSTDNGICTGNELWEMLRSVCPMPAYKFLHTACVCKSKSSWEATAESVVNQLTRYNKQGNASVSLANLAVVRGDTSSFPYSFKSVEDKLKAGYNCVRWNPFPVDLWTGQENMIGCTECSLTVCANTSSFVEYAQCILTKAKVMYHSKAYLHWYQQWGCDESNFVESFDIMENVIEAYTSAASRR